MHCASRASVGRRTLAIDLDGTLTDNFAGIAGCIRHALASLQIADPGDDALRACVGPPMRESLRTLLGSADPTLVETALAHSTATATRRLDGERTSLTLVSAAC
ncbi:MAG: HAD hydrolase-like protein [Betaproteobacteria bacterium]|nr:HAD hydrolase-like protein [Betaproteobacteria bacterium]